MNKKSKITFWIGIGLSILTLSCQTLTDLATSNATGPTPTPVSWPHSAFVPPLKESQVLVGEPLALETHHITRMANQLTGLAVYVDDLPIPTDAISGQVTFPTELATVRIVTVESPEQASLADVKPFLPPTCEDVLEQEGVVLHSPLSQYPSSEWNVCYIWIGHVPGTYDVTIVATDNADTDDTDNDDENDLVIRQRIEVIEPTP